MVRLQLTPQLTAHSNNSSGLNSTMVRLQLYWWLWRQLELFPGLNSTMVRLQQNERILHNNRWWGSQFHYGSITTLENKYPLLKELQLSQFHYGSITTSIVQLLVSFLVYSLNSTMVRLQRC